MSAAPSDDQTATRARRGRRVAFAAAGVGCIMLGLSFASVPLYRMFCAATGYGGTPRVGGVASPAAVGTREMTVRLDANVGQGLPWRFEPETPQISLRPGQTVTVFFKAQNRSDAPSSAVAAFNVGPDSAGAYFNKVACFCFEEMTLQPHESVDLPVVFFLDPALEADPTLAGVETLVLSYTVFAARPKGAASLGGAPASGASVKPL